MYRLVFDAATAGLDLGLLPVALIGLAAAIFIGFMSWQKKQLVQVIFAGVWVVLWAVGWTFGLWAMNAARIENAKLLRTGQVSVVEGVVEDFHPMPYGGHQQESFVVNGVRFLYSDYDMSTGGFNNTMSHGGPIRQGMQVRITHSDGVILQLWVVDPPKQ